MALCGSGLGRTTSYSYSLTVSRIRYDNLGKDQKKDIVSLFPDINQSSVIHSCSADRSISTYDLKQEKRVNWRQTSNGAHCGMT